MLSSSSYYYYYYYYYYHSTTPRLGNVPVQFWTRWFVPTNVVVGISPLTVDKVEVLASLGKKCENHRSTEGQQ
jgi:hypothetical protein